MAGQTIEVALGNPGPSASFQIPPKLVPFVDSVFAEIDNSAGADTTPTLEVKGPNGDTVAAVPQDAVIPGGDTGRVTWALRLAAKPAAASTGTTLAYATAWRDFGDGAQSVANGVQDYASLPHATTTDASIMAWSTTVNPNDTLNLLARGTYLPFWNAHWITDDPNGVSIIMTSGVGGIPHDPWVPDGAPLAGASAGQANSQDYNVLHVTTGGNALFFQHSNQTGGLRFVQQAYASVVYMATG